MGKDFFAASLKNSRLYSKSLSSFIILLHYFNRYCFSFPNSNSFYMFYCSLWNIIQYRFQNRMWHRHILHNLIHIELHNHLRMNLHKTINNRHDNHQYIFSHNQLCNFRNSRFHMTLNMKKNTQSHRMCNQNQYLNYCKKMNNWSIH